MANQRKGENMIRFWLTDDQVAALRRAAWYKPKAPGLSSGDSGSVKEFVLDSIGQGYKDPHEEQSAKAKK